MKQNADKTQLPKHIVRGSWLKRLTIPIGVIVMLWLFSLHVAAGFSGAIGLMLGCTGENLGWWDN